MMFAKPCLDVGLNTSNGDAVLAFWHGEIGLAYEGSLPIRRGVIQHRFEIDRSVVKINVHESALPQASPGGYREVLIARPDLISPAQLRDPDGNLVGLWPASTGGVEQIGVRMVVRDLARHQAFFRTVLGLGECESPYADSACFGLGTSRIVLSAEPDIAVDTGFGGPGWRYLTFQVFKVDEAHARMIAAGAREAMAPRTLGTTARISMVLDPDGNWIELSQRASLVGALD